MLVGRTAGYTSSDQSKRARKVPGKPSHNRAVACDCGDRIKNMEFNSAKR